MRRVCSAGIMIMRTDGRGRRAATDAAGRSLRRSTAKPRARAWDFIWDNVLRADELLPGVVALEDFQMREDGTPRYRMVRKAGPFTMSSVSDYFVFERPHRHVNRALESPFGGNFYCTYEPTPEGAHG